MQELVRILAIIIVGILLAGLGSCARDIILQQNTNGTTLQQSCQEQGGIWSPYDSSDSHCVWSKVQK